MYNRDFKGVWISRDIWLNKKLTLQEKVFLVEIDSLDRNQDGCFAGNTYFADFFGLSVSRVSEVINSLIKKEYLVAEYDRKGKQVVQRRLYTSVFGKGEEGVREIRRTYSGLAIDNNKLINKVNKLIKENEKLKSELSSLKKEIQSSSSDSANPPQTNSLTPSLADSSKKPVKEKENVPRLDNEHIKWVSNNCPTLLTMKEPLSSEQAQWFADNYPEDVWKDIMEAMENYAVLKKKSKSANLTARKWLRMRGWLPYEQMKTATIHQAKDVMGDNPRAMEIYKNKNPQAFLQ